MNVNWIGIAQSLTLIPWDSAVAHSGVGNLVVMGWSKMSMGNLNMTLRLLLTYFGNVHIHVNCGKTYGNLLLITFTVTLNSFLKMYFLVLHTATPILQKNSS